MMDEEYGRYSLIERVGQGGMSVVYRAKDAVLDREVALKLMHPHLAQRADSRARFSREAKAVARLRHRNIVEIFEASLYGDVSSSLSSGDLRFSRWMI